MLGFLLLPRPLLRTWRDRCTRIHLELIATGQAQVRVVVTDALRQSFVIGMISVFFGAGLIDVIGIAIRPRFDGLATVVTDTPFHISHIALLRRPWFRSYWWLMIRNAL